MAVEILREASPYRFYQAKKFQRADQIQADPSVGPGAACRSVTDAELEDRVTSGGDSLDAIFDILCEVASRQGLRGVIMTPNLINATQVVSDDDESDVIRGEPFENLCLMAVYGYRAHQVATSYSWHPDESACLRLVNPNVEKTSYATRHSVRESSDVFVYQNVMENVRWSHLQVDYREYGTDVEAVTWGLGEASASEKSTRLQDWQAQRLLPPERLAIIDGQTKSERQTDQMVLAISLQHAADVLAGQVCLDSSRIVSHVGDGGHGHDGGH